MKSYFTLKAKGLSFLIGKSILTMMIFMLSAITLTAQITGTAFRDYNGNGTQEGGEPGRDGIIVNFYSNAPLPAKDAFIGSTTTDANGDYSFNPASYPVRVEFEIPNGLCNISSAEDYSGANGDNYGTAVQFAAGPSTVDFVVAYPYDFNTDDNPLSFVAVMGSGDPLAGGNAGEIGGIAKFNYKNTGYASNSGRGNNSGFPYEDVALQKQVGNIWGMALSRQSKKLFAASAVRRHSGMGPEGSGGIYWLDAEGPYDLSGSLKFVDFDNDLGIPTSNQGGTYTQAYVGGSCSGSGEVFFSDVLGTNAERGLPSDMTNPSSDPAAWAQVGRLSFGDMDISEDGQYLYVVNLHDRKLYQIDLQDPFNPQVPTAAQVQSFDIPDPCNAGDPDDPRGEARPWALKVSRGKVFVGVTCSGQREDGTNPDLASSVNMLGTVYEWDPISQTFDPMPALQFDFSYRDGTSQPWVPWRRDWWDISGDRDGCPLITDIEFDANGNMILGVKDMHASQLGHRNADLCGTVREDARQVGDILQAVRDKDAQACEYSIQFTPEYYNDNKIHLESAMGALSVHFTADFDGILGTMMDPIGIWSSGLMLWDNNSGSQQSTNVNPGGTPMTGYETTYSTSSNQGRFGKANSLGDVETLGEVPSLEIGNLIWIDTDRDGIQDGGEPPVPGVTVELLDAGGNVIATDVTDANGNYIFNYLNVDDRGPGKVDVLGPQPNTTYSVRISPTQFTGGKGTGILEGTFLTLSNEAGSTGEADYQDNDGVLDGNGVAFITLMTGEVGANDHTYDFGLQETFFDLALKKVTNQTQPVRPGDDVDFTIRVYNQGAGLADVNDIKIVDYVPSGYDFIPGNNPGWSGTPPQVEYTIAGPLAIGDSIDVTIQLRVNATAQPDNVINEAEIVEFEDEDDNIQVDEDSTPDNDPDNDNDVIPYSDDDNEINERAKLNPGDDEDDNDVETVPILDLALAKVIKGGGPSSYSYGDEVSFEITVTNQGNITATDIEVVDYVPSGFVYNPVNPTNILQGWTPAPTNMPVLTIAGPLDPGQSETVTIVLDLIDADPDNGAYVNYAEIKSVEDEDGNDVSDRDIDSDADMTDDNDVGGTPETGEDNHIDDNGQDSDGDGITDEDDHDPALVRVWDLALRKRVATPPIYLEGDLIDFTITVFNQGNDTTDNIEIRDYVPPGLTYNQGDNPGWSAGPNPTITLPESLSPGDSASVTISLTALDTDGPDSDWWNYSEIISFTDEDGNTVEDADSNPGSNNGTESSVEPGSAADDDIISTDKGGEEDDHDVAGIEISEFDLALRKTTDQTQPVKVGESVTWTIKVFNQGDAPVDQVQVVDYVPCGLEFVQADNPQWAPVGDSVYFDFVGIIMPGDSATTSLDLIVRGGQQGDSTCFINEAEIASFTDIDGNPRPDVDSTPDDDPDNDNDVTPGSDDDDEIDEDAVENPGDDEDDNDVAMVDIYDLALRKTTVTPPPYRYGDMVVFNIEVHNQGTMVADEIEVIDYVPAGFTYLSSDPTNVSNGWTGAPTNLPTTTISTPLGVGQSTTLQIALEVTPGSLANDRFVNFAEIASSEDAFGNDMSDRDYDSTPNKVNGDEVGGNVNTSSDDWILDDGDDTDGDGILDEDDHDPEDIEVFDLALKKELITPQPYDYGDLIRFDITVINQGTMVAEDVVITDDIPIGYTYDPAENLSWTQASTTTPQTTIAGPMNPGDEVVLSIYLTLEQVLTPGESDWINYSWIETAKDTLGNTPVDADSDMGTDAAHERDVLPDSDNDNEVDEHYVPDGSPADEDDHDPAEVQVFDLALIKQPAQTGPYTYGQSVPFDITVYNQGNIGATDVTIYDYLQPGFEFDFGQNFPTWNYIPDPVNIATTTIADGSVLEPGQSETVTIWLIVQPTDVENPTAWTNVAEIADASDEDGDDIDDIDSQEDGDDENDAGGEPNTDTDDQLDGDGTDDEDDSDPAIVEIVDLALTKKVVTPGPYSYGQLVEFEIEVTNQGNVTSRNTEVTDYIPVGFGFDQADNGSWSDTAPTVTTIIPGDIGPGESETISIFLTVEMTAGGQKDWINYSEISNITDTTGVNRNLDEADSTPGSNNPTENEVEPWDPEDDDIDSNDKGGEEDDHDPAGIEVQDLAVFMLDDTDILADYGDDVTFPIMVFNQGSVTNDGFTLTNYVPSGYVFNSVDNPGWVQVNDSTLTYEYPNSIVPGEQVDLTLILEAVPSKGEAAWTNVIEISTDNPVSLLGANLIDIDSDPDQMRTNDAGGAVETASDDVVNGDGKNGGGVPLDENPDSDEDDQDPEVVRVFDLALKKNLLASEPYTYGEAHEFEVCVINQGNEPMTQVEVTDYIPKGYSFDAGLSVGWTGINDSTATYIIDRIEDCDTVCVSIFLTLEMTQGGERDWINYSEITEMSDSTGTVRDDVDSNPGSDGPDERGVEPGDPEDDDTDSNDKGGEEDDHDPAGPDIFDVALIKTSQEAGPFEYGDEITFDVWVYNQGNVGATNIEVTEYVPVGYEWVPGNNANWSWDAGNRVATLTNLISSIAPGDSALVQLDLEILQSYEVGAWDNYAEISNVEDEDGNPGDDIDSDPNDDQEDDQGGVPDSDDDDEINEDGTQPGEDEDDQDPHRPEIVDLALNKRVPGKEPFYIPGDTVPFVLTVYNQGNVPAANTLIKDYMPQGFAFDNTIPENIGWSDNAGTLEYTLAPTLFSQDSAKINLYLVVQIAAMPTLLDWTNYAEIGEIRDTTGTVRVDADSNPSSDADHERDVMDNDDGDDRDDVVTGDWKSDPTQDEDDHDPEKVEVTGAIGDFVWKDLDGDGIQDDGEPGIPDVIVTLYTCEGELVKVDTTDADGFYLFDFLIPLESYYAIFDISPLNMPDCVFTFPNEGVNDSLDSDVNAAGVGPCTFIEPGERDSTYDAGLVELASLGDFVWHDRDADGIQEGGDEEGIPDVIVRLYNTDDEIVAVDTTDEDGFYLFEDLMPTEYYVEFDYMPMWLRTPSNIGGNDAVDSDVDDSNGPNTTRLIDLDPGENDLTWDLGLYKCIETGDYVWFDNDADGIQDAPENGVNGVRVYVYDAGGLLVDQAITGPDPRSASADGYYKFCLDPGTYYIVFERPGHLASSMPFAGGDNEKDSDITNTVELYSTYFFTVRSGDMRCDIDGGFHSKATMGDRVWLDENGNGIQDGSEPRVPGVMISAYNSDGLMLWQDESDANGEFYMDGLSMGDYYLKFDPPAGYTFTLPDQGGDDGMDSDVDGSNGPRTTALYRVNPGEHEPDVDGGLIQGFLPIELIDFRAEYLGDKVEVTWTTAVEINNEYYEVERRHESETAFRVIGKLDAAGTVYTTQDYGYDDYDVSRPGLYYYRLRQVDTDGTDARSEVRVVEVAGVGNGVHMYPNPASDILNIELRIGSKEDLHCEIFLVDPLGRILPEYTLSRALETGIVTEELNVENLAPGMYTVRIQIGDEIQRLRFTKI